LSRRSAGTPGDTPPPLVADAKSEGEAEERQSPGAAPPAEPAPVATAKSPDANDAVADAQQAASAPDRDKKTRGSAGADASVAPYVADWEQGSGEMATPIGYRLSVSSAEVLFNLSGIARQANGAVRDSAGRVLQPRMLSSSDDYAQPMLVVPREQTEAVRGHLQAMGGEPIPTPSATSLYPADFGVFVVEVRYRP
jgi:hypothetical protein